MQQPPPPPSATGSEPADDRHAGAARGVQTDSPEALPADRGSRAAVATARVVVAFLWIQNTDWKIPTDFGRDRNADLFVFVQDAVEHPVVPAYAWLVEHVVLPNLTVFGYLTLFTEFGLGVFLLAGLFTRLWAAIGIAQSLAIALSVLNTPGEWHWSYYLMMCAHLLLLATAAGRTAGLDAVLRPRWRRSDHRLARLALVAS